MITVKHGGGSGPVKHWERDAMSYAPDEKVLRPFNRKMILTALTRRGVALKEEMEANGKAQSPD